MEDTLSFLVNNVTDPLLASIPSTISVSRCATPSQPLTPAL